MQRYDSYKDSGIQWLGEIPSHWEVVPLKYCMILNNGRDYKEYESNNGIPVIGTGGQFAYSNKEMFNGEVVFFGRKGTIDKPFHYKGAFWAVDTVFYAEAKSNMICRYLYYLGTTIPYGLYSTSTAIPSMTQTDLLNNPISLPPLPEQQAIASYLDTVTAKIDEAIAQQQKMIDLLNERKQIIINNAVTKGLNPNAPTKPSGIDWIGNIPEHWEVCKLKRVANGFSNGTSATQIAFGTTQYPVTRIETITTGSINYDKVGYVKKDSSLNRYLLKKYDVLISNINSFERVGNCAIYDGQHELYHGMNLLRITPLDDIVPEYLLYSLKSMSYMGQMRRACKPAINQVSVPSSGVKGIMITLPPLSEQEEIANYCSRAMQCIDDSVDICRKQIALLQERKQIIINDVVTGKVKVCNN